MGRPALHEVFGTDSILSLGTPYGPCPRFAYELLEEDERTKVYVNREGIVMREFKARPETSKPQFIRFPVEDEAGFETWAAERLGLNQEDRFPNEWQVKMPYWADGSLPRRCCADRWSGFFGPLRNLVGVENLCLAFYDQPALIERMMEQRADAIIAIAEEVLRHTSFEVFCFWEDVACRHGPLIGPDLYRRFALKHYRRVCDWLHSRDVRHIWLDSDGNTEVLLPLVIGVGITFHWPFERDANMDPLRIRTTCGHDLGIGGGIDKRELTKGRSEIDAELHRVLPPLLEDGGYIPTIDHAVPPDIPYGNFQYYLEVKRRLLGY